MQKQTKQLILNKNGEQYIFRCDLGSEDRMLEALLDYAENQNLSFDYFDASVVSFKLTKNLIDQAQRLVKKNNPKQNSFLR